MSDFDSHFPAVQKMETNWELIHQQHQDNHPTTNNKDHVWLNIGGSYWECLNCRERKQMDDQG